MKNILAILLVVILAAGCATTSKDKKSGSAKGPMTDDEKVSASLECIRIAGEARKENNAAEEKAALGLALKYLSEVDADNRAVLADSAGKIRGIIAISGFEYAPKESNELLLTYMEMQNAYADHDGEKLKALNDDFGAKFEKARSATADAKQKKIDVLAKEVASKDVKKQTEPDSSNPLPSIYTVKKGDTLPSVAARHDIYNDSFMWPIIYKANRDQIKDPKVLYGGQELKIPRDMSLDDIIQARKEAGAAEPEKIPKDAFTPRRTK